MAKADFLGLDAFQVWDTESAFQHLKASHQAETKRTSERRLHELALLPDELDAGELKDETGRPPLQLVLKQALEKARSQRKLVLFAQLHSLPGGRQCLHANDARGARYWLPLKNKSVDPAHIVAAIQQLRVHIGKDLAIFPHGQLVALCRQTEPLKDCHLLAYPSALNLSQQAHCTNQGKATTPHLRRLESECIHILREAVAESDNPVMLYSAGKDSSVMLHLARKAFTQRVRHFR